LKGKKIFKTLSDFIYILCLIFDITIIINYKKIKMSGIIAPISRNKQQGV